MPARLRDLKRSLESLGVRVDEPARGSHWHASKDGRRYPIPAHNSLKSEIQDVYIRGVCRALGLDEAELRRRL